MKRLSVFLLAALCLSASASGSLAAGKVAPAANAATAPEPKAPKPVPYDDRLTRLSEILGSMDFIRNLCAGQPEPQWKELMARLLDSDAKDEPERRAKLTAAFNRGYRSFSAIQTTCSAPLRAAAERYRAEGATLATEIAARFGN